MLGFGFVPRGNQQLLQAQPHRAPPPEQGHRHLTWVMAAMGPTVVKASMLRRHEVTKHMIIPPASKIMFLNRVPSIHLHGATCGGNTEREREREIPGQG